MFPILYESLNVGVIPQHHGLGVLSDCIDCRCEEARNSIYELTFDYPMSGIHAQELAQYRIIKEKPNPTDDPQLFYIDRIGKVMNGKFTVYCKHVSYLLSGYEITSGTAGSAIAACALLQNAASGFTISTDKSTTGNFKITEPSSVRSWFGGKEGSLLDVYGTGEWQYNNFTCTLKLHRGADRGETIRYGKNLLELSQEIDASNLYTHVQAYWKKEDTTVLSSKVSTGLNLGFPRTLVLDLSSAYEEAPTNQQLTDKVNNYISSNNLTTPSNNIKLDFVQSGELTNRVDLCDTVSIYYEALGITRTQMKCIRTVYDCLREKYIETEFGDTRTNITDTMVAQTQAIEAKPSKSYLAEAVAHATQLITGNLGGHLIIHDSNGDGEPDELLIMDTDDISTAVNVWRFNQAGWGHSSNGYDGTYTLAATLDGGMVANFITTGFMSADRVRSGMIVSENGFLIIDLDAGTITAPSITLNGEDVEATLDSLVQTSVVTRYALSNSGTVIPSNFPLEAPTQPTEQQPYLWTRTVYTYANGQVNTSYNVSVRGANGQDGQDGAGIDIKGDYDTMADLIADHPTGSAGDAYLVAGDLVMWNTQTNSWEDKGRIQGPSGADGLWLAIDNDDDGTNSNVTYTAHLMKGLSTDATSQFSSVFAWYLVNESGVTLLAQNTNTITVARDSANYGSTIRCVCVAVIDEEPLQDYSYVTITDYQGNDITVIGANNVQLIGESELYKPYAISSQFQVLSDEISSKVSQTDFNSLLNTVTQQGTAIQQNAEAITLKANQTTVNTLSNTVSSQGTAIQQNAEAITLKANTSYVDSGLNDKMNSNMSNRASSITINSGEIKFESNTVSVSSTNFTLTKTGQVTSVDFNAKNSLKLLDTNNVIRGQLDYTSSNGAQLKLQNPSGKNTVFLYGSDEQSGNGGTLFLSNNNSKGRIVEWINNNDGGDIYILNSSDKVAARMLVGGSGHGALLLYNGSNTQKIGLYGDSGDINATGRVTGGSFGAVASVGAVSGTSLSTTGNVTATGRGIFTGSISCGGLTAKTQIVAADNSNNTRVFFAAGTSGYGALRNNSGDNNIYFYGETGNIEIAGRIIQGSSRKIKKNIMPIEDSEKILELQAVSFDYINEEVGKDRRGFIAEDVAEVLPNLVQSESEGHNASLDYIGMIPYLQDVIKKQQADIDYLKAEIEKLKGEK